MWSFENEGVFISKEEVRFIIGGFFFLVLRVIWNRIYDCVCLFNANIMVYVLFCNGLVKDELLLFLSFSQ
jgi:hypothetical protein